MRSWPGRPQVVVRTTFTLNLCFQDRRDPDGVSGHAPRLVTHQGFIPLSVHKCNIGITCGQSCELQGKHRQARFRAGR